MWYQMRESLHENEIQPQPYSIEGIINLALVLMGFLAAVLAVGPVVKVLQKLTILIWPTYVCKVVLFFKN